MRKLFLFGFAFIATLAACGDDPTAPKISSPAIDSIVPAWGTAGGQVRIYGRSFAGDGIKVFIGSVQTSAPQFVSSTQLSVVVPEGLMAGKFDVRVMNRDGGTVTRTAAFEYVVPPVIDSISPRRGTVGTEVRIYGSRFTSDSLAVYFGDLKSPKVQLSGGSVFATAPEGITLGSTYDIRVLNRLLEADTIAAAFQVVRPKVARANGVTKPTGLVGMLIFVEGDAFGDVKHGKAYFRASDGTRIQAVIADSANDWANTYVLTTVPTGTADSGYVWVETASGTDSIEFKLIKNGVFSPSTINWTQTTALPRALQGLGAVFVPIEEGATPGNYVFTLGGADSANVATTAVYRAKVQQTGALDAWNTSQTALPAARAYHTTVGATAYTAALDTTTTGAYLYVIGGKDGAGKTMNTVYHARVGLDGQVGSWSTGPALPVPLHSASAAVFRGYIYLAGGADSAGKAQAQMYRASVSIDGALGAWESITALPAARSHFALVNLGPYLYAIGGETGTTTPVSTALSGTETATVGLARINLRTGGIASGGWSAVTGMSKARSKHAAVFAGGALFVSSGIYSGIGVSGSSENTYAEINSDGTLGSWQGATGSETINTEIGYSLYNQAMVTFIDNTGKGHVLVLGGANTSQQGQASAKVVYY